MKYILYPILTISMVLFVTLVYMIYDARKEFFIYTNVANEAINIADEIIKQLKERQDG